MPNTQTLKRPTNLTLDSVLLAEAKALKVNLSQAAEHGVRQAVAKAKSLQWKHENAEALKSSNQWVDDNGLPLDAHRQF